jgi:hypothetical protein
VQKYIRNNLLSWYAVIVPLTNETGGAFLPKLFDKK